MADSDPRADATAANDASLGGVNISGGTVNAGNIIGRDLNVFTEEAAFDVRGLENPYLGLAAFTYAERAKYAGREKLIAETVTRITAPSAPIALLFVTGASGSGKSSFVQAGLLPALEVYYEGFAVKRAVMRPAGDPVAALKDALWRQLQVVKTFDGLGDDSIAKNLEGLLEQTPPSQINLLVLDQFEEFFTQAPQAAREVLFGFLENLPTFGKTRTHVVATMRADYLPDLFNYSGLYDIAKRGVDLRVMNAEELTQAIQQPLRVSPFANTKRFESSLVDKLAEDAAQDAAYLPLLQVTLQEIWRKGSLKREAYTNLTDAIKQRADQILEYRDFDAAAPDEKRDAAEQSALLDLLLDLVDVSPSDDAHRDVRRQRAKTELTHGDVQRERWVNQLAAARLLSVQQEGKDSSRIEVDLIHETLLTNWTRLQSAIAERRTELRRRARFEQNLDEWKTQNRSDEYLLEGVRLAEARELEAGNDIALQNEDAKQYLRASNVKAEAVQQEELERERQRAEALKQRARIFRIAAIGLSVLLVVAILASFLAYRATEEANLQRDAAVQANATAGVESNKRALAESQAIVERDNASTAEADALAQATAANQANATSQAEAIKRGTAEANALAEATAANEAKETAQAESIISNSKSLAAQSGLLREGDLDASLLLGIEGLNLSQNYETRNNLWTALETTHLLVSMYENADIVRSVAFSSDGKTLASGGDEGTIRLWDVRDLTSARTLGELPTGDRTGIFGVAFSPDGKILVAVSSEMIRLWDVSDSTHVQPLGKPFSRQLGIRCVAFSADGKLLASGSQDSTIQLWDVSDPTNVKAVGIPITPNTDQVLIDNNNQVLSVVFSPDGKTLAAGSGNGRIRLLDVRDPSHPQEFSAAQIGHTSPVYSVAFSADSKTLASGGRDRTIRLWDVSDPMQATALGTPLTGHTGAVFSVAFSSDGKTLASGSEDRSIYVWDLNNLLHPKAVGTPLRGHTGAVASVAFGPNGKTLVSGSDDQTIRLWDVSYTTQPKELGTPLTGHSNIVKSVAFTPDGSMLASGSGDATIQLWDLSNPMQSKALGEPLKGHTDTVESVVFSPDGKTLASGSADNTIRLWDVSNSMNVEVLGTLTGHTDSVTSVAFSPDGKTLASGSADNTIRLWDVSDPIYSKALGMPLKARESTIYSIAFSRDGKILVSGSADSMIRLWDVTDPMRAKLLSIPLEGHSSTVDSLAFSLDGKTLASGSVDKTIRLWDLSDPMHSKPLGGPLTGHTEAVNSLAFDSDSKILASGSADNTIRLWDMSDPAHAKVLGVPFTGHTSSVSSVAFSLVDQRLASAGDDGTIRLWDTNLESKLLVSRACQIVSRNLTRLEYARYINSDAAAYDGLYAKEPTCPKSSIEPPPTQTP